MPDPTQFKTAEEIRKCAQGASSAILPIEVAQTLPVPKRVSDGFLIQILFFREVFLLGKVISSAPDHCMLLDPQSGKVVRFWAVKPEELGIHPGTRGVPGASGPTGKVPDGFFAKKDRLFAISRPVWVAFFRGGIPDDPEVRALAREYRQLFLETTKPEVARFTVAASVEFFEWLDSAAK